MFSFDPFYEGQTAKDQVTVLIIWHIKIGGIPTLTSKPERSRVVGMESFLKKVRGRSCTESRVSELRGMGS
jgi:hypothetical protein